MPPKSKPPKPQDPLAHLSQAERKKVATQLRKRVPRLTRSTAGTDDTLPDAVDLAAVSSKQVVHFADTEDGVEYAVETDGSVAEDREEGEDGDGDSAGGEDEGGNADAAGGSDRKPAKSRKGRAAGSTGYSKAEEWIIVEGMERYLPRGEMGWRKVAKYFNHHVPQKRQRDWDLIKNKYGRMTKRKKPTGDGDGSKIHDAVLAIEDMRITQEDIADIDDEGWSESDAEDALDQPPPKKIRIKVEPTPVSISARAPAPAPFRRPKTTPSKPTPKEPEILVLSSTDDDDNPAAHPQTTPAKSKAHPGVKAEPGTTYYAAKAPQVTEVKAKPDKRHKNARSLVEELTTTLKNATRTESANDKGAAKVEVFGRDRTIERLEKELAECRERCHQLERQADNVAMAMTMYGIQVSASDRASGPGLGLALLGFLRARFPAVVPADAALAAAAPAAASVAAPATQLIAPVAHLTPMLNEDSNDFPEFEIDPALYDKPEGVSFVSSAPSGSNLSITEKGKLPIHPGN